MQTVSKSKLKTHMLKILGEIEKSGQGVIVTDNSRPILKIQPIQRAKSVQELFGDLQGRVIYNEDINTPTESEWVNS